MEKNQNKKGFKKIILLLLLFVGFGAAITAGAYWAGTVTITTPAEVTENYEVTIGHGDTKTVETNISVLGSITNDKMFVPATQVGDGSTKTSSVSFDVKVNWNYTTPADQTQGYVGTGAVEITDSLSIASTLTDDRLEDLFTVEIVRKDGLTEPTIVLGGSVVYTITVNFVKEPLDKAEYDLVAEKVLTLTLVFGVVVNS